MSDHAKDHECCMPGCNTQAVAWWPVIDPDINPSPYCRPCLDRRKEAVISKLLKGDYGYGKA